MSGACRKTIVAALLMALATPVAARAPEAPVVELPIAVARQTGPARQRLQENAAEIAAAFKSAGAAFRPEDEAALAATAAMPDAQAIGAIQKVLDRYALALVDINDEAWFQIMPAAKSPAGRPLRQNRWATFLIKVNNHSRATSPFEVRSLQAVGGATGEVGVPAAAAGECEAPSRSWAQWFRLGLLREPAMPERLSGKEIEYFVLQICSLDAGDRAAELTFYLGGGQVSQGHYGAIGLLFQPTKNGAAETP